MRNFALLSDISVSQSRQKRKKNFRSAFIFYEIRLSHNIILIMILGAFCAEGQQRVQLNGS